MWIDQQGKIEPKNAPRNYVGFDTSSPVSRFRELSFSDHVDIESGYQPCHQRILQPTCVSGKHVRFDGLSPVSYSKLPDRVSIVSGYQPQPIPCFSGSWVALPPVFLKEQPAISRPYLQPAFDVVEYGPSGNLCAMPSHSIPSIGRNFNNISTMVESMKPTVVRERNQILFKDNRRIVGKQENKNDEPVMENLELYRGERCGSMTHGIQPSFVPPSVLSTIEVVQLPAYTSRAKSFLPSYTESQHSRKAVSSVIPFNTATQSTRALGLSSRRRTETDVLKMPNTTQSFTVGGNRSGIPQKNTKRQIKDEVPQKVNGKLDKGTQMKNEDKVPAKATRRTRSIGLVRYTVPSSDGKKKTVTIKVDLSIPSMDKIKIEHGHNGDIFIGNFHGACSYELCKKNNIAAIMNLSTKTLRKDPEITYYAFPIGDLPSEDILSLFNMTFNIIEGHLQSGQNVLVNCNMGVSRSTTIVLAYIMKKTRMELNSALALCRSFRTCCNPNPGFIKQLTRHQELIQEKKVEKDVSQDANSSETKAKAWQRFSFSFPSCYARANIEDARASSKEIVPRRSYSVL